MRTLIYYASFWLYLIGSLVSLLWIVLLRCVGQQERVPGFAARQARAWARTMVWLSGADVSLEGLENVPSEGGFILCSNHQGAFDIPLLLGFSPRPIGFVAKEELRRIPLLGRWMREIGCLFLDRENARQGLAVTRDGVERLKQGAGLVIFPEGTRSGSDQLGPFHQGSLHMALASGAPVVPVTIIDSHKLREAQGSRIRPARVRVVLSPAIATAAMQRSDKKALLERIRGIIAENLTQGVPPLT